MTLKEILSHVRRLLSEHAAGDPDKWWYANRYVFARLQLDERQTKTAVKRRLFDAGATCHACGKGFNSRRGVHLHRVNGNRGYGQANCVLLHAKCHEKHHAGGSQEVQPGGHKAPRTPKSRRYKAPAHARTALHVKESKRHEGKPFLYWWDITSMDIKRLNAGESMAFAQEDTGRRCILTAATLKEFLTPERRTTRRGGNWGIKVLKDRRTELAFEPGRADKAWRFLRVDWVR